MKFLGSSFYGQLNEKLVQLQNEYDGCLSVCMYVGNVQNALREMIIDQKTDFDANKQKIDKINTGLDRQDFKDLIQAQSDILMLKISIIKDVTNWRNRLSKFFELKKKEDKVLAKTASKMRVASGNNVMQISMEFDHQPISLPALLTTESTNSPSNKSE